MRWRTGLTARILLLAIGLVTLTALAIGLATVQFARSAARAEQRAELKAQAALLTLQSGRLVTERALRRVAPGLDGTAVSVYDAGGSLLLTTARRDTAPVIRRTRAAALRAVGGTAVTTSIRIRGAETLVEARPTADGGAIVLSHRATALTRTAGAFAGGVLLTLVVCLALAGLAAVLLARRIAQPLTATAAAARRLAGGEREVPVPEASTAEVADVADALQALDAALRASEGRQREFLLSISHELRTPLTALRGYGEAIADGLLPPDRLPDAGGTIVAEAERLEHFTTDLLELARLEADEFPVRPVPLDLADIVHAALDAWRPRAAALDVRLDGEGLDQPAHARGDPLRVRQVLDGIVENALRATPAGGSVSVLVAGGTRTATVAVEDTGPGLSDDDLANAFRRGLLRERYRETREVGTGLGLSIATRLADRMGGRVVAEHARRSTGARFTLELPV